MTALPLLVALAVQQPETRILDAFEDVTGWSAHPADGVDLTLRSDAGYRGRGMRLDFAFRAGGGYAVVRKTLSPLELPDDYEFAFYVRGAAPDNNLEFKLIDSTGDNVWWVNRRDFHFPRAWTKLTIKKRQIVFAWGPAGGGELRRVAAIELAISAGSGGAGSVWIDELTLRSRPPAAPDSGPPLARASSATATGPPTAALDGQARTAWHSLPGDAQWLALDFRRPREYGGLMLDWDPDDYATDYDVQTSVDARRWETVYSVAGGHGGRQHIPLPESESRHLRLLLRRSSRAHGYALAELVVEPLEFAASPNQFFEHVARDAPRGAYPKYFTGRQSYWTVVGVSGGLRPALLNEEGMLEPAAGGFSIEPFLWTAGGGGGGGRLVTWSDATLSQSLLDDDLPIPSVRWQAGDLTLTITAFADGPRGRPGCPGAATLYAAYRVENRGRTAARIRLFLALRPFQVNPPWQSLNTQGGAAEIRALAYDGRTVLVNGRTRIVPINPPDGFGATTFDQGEIARWLSSGALPTRRRAAERHGWASGALAYQLELGPGVARDVYLAVPPPGDAASPRPPTGLRDSAASALVARRLAETRAAWVASLNRVSIGLPPSGGGVEIVHTLRSTLAYILINRSGAALQPGPRAYARSWIRDGALMGAALLRLGHDAEVRQFIEWYALHQYASGKIPCCVDSRGADPVPEHDSPGEFIYLVAEYFRATGDSALPRALWPRVARAAAYIDSLRLEDRTPEYRGLLPPSISHEGYSAKPMHSYWDDFWALRGLGDAALVARVAGAPQAAARLATGRDELRAAVVASLRAVMRRRDIDYLPGAAELGDFDAPSTAIALAPGDELGSLPADAVRRTFDHYYATFRARRDGRLAWDAYTPYELRVAGALVRLDEPERARELLAFFLGDRRPRPWNAWGEVVWRDLDAPKFIGDMPHTWVGAEFVRSVLDLFAYERASDSALVVGAGIAPEWVTTEPGVAVRDLGTAFGRLSFTVAGAGDSVQVRIAGGLRVPPGGVIVRSPLGRAATRIVVNGVPAARSPAGEVTVRTLPAELTFRY